MIIEVFAGLGMFLFGMHLMENALKDAAGSRFKKIIQRSTNSTFKALSTGAFATAFLQSSSVVSLMTLAFVGAGLISLSSGIGVIFGANLGTTATGWIVAILGFKVKVDAFALPMIGLGGIGMIFFASKRKIVPLFMGLMGFGLLFLGLDYMKEAMGSVADTIDLKEVVGQSALLFVLLGFALTAVVQSSSAAMAIVLTGLGGGMIGFHEGAAMAIGANVGTTVTAILGALGGSADKKRVAVAHVLFNTLTGVVAFALLSILIEVVSLLSDIHHDPIIALALFHTLFNFLGVLLFMGFIPLLSRWLSKRFHSAEHLPTRFIHDVSPRISDAALEAASKETQHLLEEVLRYVLLLLNVPPKPLFELKERPSRIVFGAQKRFEIDAEAKYKRLKQIEDRILVYIASMGKESLHPEQTQRLETLMRALKEGMHGAKTLKDIKHNIDAFASSESPFLQQRYDAYRLRFAKLIKQLVRMIRKEGKDSTVTKLVRQLREIRHQDQQATVKITQAIISGDIEKEASGSVIHVDRAVFIAATALLDAVRAHTLDHYEQNALDVIESIQTPIATQETEGYNTPNER